MSIYPTLQYDDLPRALAFISTTLGMRPNNIIKNDDGDAIHAEVFHGNSAVLVGARKSDPGPFDTGRAVLFLVAEEVDAHHNRAVAAGAELVMELTDQPYGSREYAVRDPEGNIWTFGTYRPTGP